MASSDSVCAAAAVVFSDVDVRNVRPIVVSEAFERAIVTVAG
jgi:hypothetical protein